MNKSSAKAAGHTIIPDKLLIEKNKNSTLNRVPWIYEPECVGCNLCKHVCPIEDCITMELRSK